MMRVGKRLFAFFMCMTMVLGIGVIASATDQQSDTVVYKTNKDGEYVDVYGNAITSNGGTVYLTKPAGTYTLLDAVETNLPAGFIDSVDDLNDSEKAVYSATVAKNPSASMDNIVWETTYTGNKFRNIDYPMGWVSVKINDKNYLGYTTILGAYEEVHLVNKYGDRIATVGSTKRVDDSVIENFVSRDRPDEPSYYTYSSRPYTPDDRVIETTSQTKVTTTTSTSSKEKSSAVPNEKTSIAPNEKTSTAPNEKPSEASDENPSLLPDKNKTEAYNEEDDDYNNDITIKSLTSKTGSSTSDQTTAAKTTVASSTSTTAPTETPSLAAPLTDTPSDSGTPATASAPKTGDTAPIAALAIVTLVDGCVMVVVSKKIA